MQFREYFGGLGIRLGNNTLWLVVVLVREFRAGFITGAVFIGGVGFITGVGCGAGAVFITGLGVVNVRVQYKSRQAFFAGPVAYRNVFVSALYPGVLALKEAPGKAAGGVPGVIVAQHGRIQTAGCPVYRGVPGLHINCGTVRFALPFICRAACVG